MSEDPTNLLEDLLDQHDYDMPQEGDIRTGTIVAMTPQGAIVDLGLKRDGIVPTSDLNKLEQEERDELKVNDEVFVYVVQTSDPEALVVSIHLARLNQDWIEAEALMESGEIFEGEVIGYNKGGVIVPYGRIRGFVPISHLTELAPGMGERRRQQRLARLRGEKLGLKIIEVDRRRHRLVLSQREAQREWEETKRAELMETLAEGETRVGRVSGIRDFGAFVNLGGADGLVHISELSWHRIDHPREVVRVGDEIEVYVLGIDREKQRISLSRKKLLANPWDSVDERYEVNQLVEGKITRIMDYGAFAEIEPGIEGLLHVSQLSRATVDNPNAVVNEGETHLLRIVSIDQNRQRIGLSLKAVTANEQIEWMAQKEIEEEQRREEEEAAAAAAASEEAAVDAAEEVVDSAEDMVEAVTEEAEAVVETAEEVEVAVVEEAAEVVEETEAAAEAVEEAIEEAAEETVDEIVEETAEAVADASPEEAETIVEAAEETVAEVVEEASEAIEAVEEEAEEVVAEVVEEASATVEAVQEVATDAVEEATEVVDEVVEAAAETVDEIEEAAAGVVDEAAEVVEQAVETAEDVADDVAEAADDVVSGAEEAAAAVVDAVEEVVEESDAGEDEEDETV